MATFIEKLIQNELPTDGFKPFVTQKELLREEVDRKGVNNLLRPAIRGFFSQNWKHGHSLTQGERAFSIEFSDRIGLGNCFLRPHFILQNGTKALYRASLGVNLGQYGDLEFTQQAKNMNVGDQYQITHYSSINGLNSKASLSFEGPQHNPVVNLSSLYNMTMEVFDRRTKQLNKTTTIYGQDASFNLFPFRQMNYSLYYQAKAPNLDMIAAYMRKEVADKLYSNDIVAGVKHRTPDNKKLLAKVSYNLEEKVPHFDVMIRNTHNTDRKIKTFHKVSSDLKVGSGFTLSLHRLKLNGLVEVNLMNNNLYAQPFSFSLRLETNERGLGMGYGHGHGHGHDNHKKQTLF